MINFGGQAIEKAWGRVHVRQVFRPSAAADMMRSVGAGRNNEIEARKVQAPEQQRIQRSQELYAESRAVQLLRQHRSNILFWDREAAPAQCPSVKKGCIDRRLRPNAMERFEHFFGAAILS